MTAPHAVISGASIAGLSTAFWLGRAGWRVTVLERAPHFRDGGQNVDVRGVAREVLDRMGLTEAVREQNTTETGTVVVDGRGRVVAELPSDGPDGATAELEILRGDLARTVLDALPDTSPDGVELVYDDTVASTAEHAGGITVTTLAGRVLEADLLVVAEGVRSSTRDLLLADLVELRDLGVTMVFGTIPRVPDDDTTWRWHNAVGGRQVHLRPDNHGTTRAMLAHTRGEDLTALDHDDAMARLRERYAHAGWQAERVLEGLASSDDVYVDQLTQVRMRSYHRGRVCVVGDAAWCVTPMGGGGSSLALTGAYVLAASLSTAGTDRLDRLEEGLDAYEAWMRPMAEKAQRMPPGVAPIAYPRTRGGIAVRNLVLRVATSGPLRALAARIPQVASTEQPLPEPAVASRP